jgi:hypothetical protein
MSRKRHRMVVSVGVLAAVLLLLALVLPQLPDRPLAAPINSCINNLRQINGATLQWAEEHDKDTNDVPTWAEILPYMTYVPKCRSRGNYTLGSASQPPTCSIPKHVLPEFSEEQATVLYYLKDLREQESERNLESAEQDRQALIKLGCFEQRGFLLTHRSLTTNNVSELVEMVTNTVFINYNYALTLNLWTNTRVVAVIAHRGDMGAWGGLVSRFDSAEAR